MSSTKRNTPKRPKSLALRLLFGTLKVLGFTIGGLLLLIIVLLFTIEETMPIPQRLVNDSAHLLNAEATQRLEALLTSYRTQHRRNLYIATTRDHWGRSSEQAAAEIAQNWQEEGVPIDQFIFLTANSYASGSPTEIQSAQLRNATAQYRKWAETILQEQQTERSALAGESAPLLEALRAASETLDSASGVNTGAIDLALWGANAADSVARASMRRFAQWGETELALATGVLAVIANHPAPSQSENDEGVPYPTQPHQTQAAERNAGGGATWFVAIASALLIAAIGVTIWKRRKRKATTRATAKQSATIESTPIDTEPVQQVPQEAPKPTPSIAPAEHPQAPQAPQTPPNEKLPLTPEEESQLALRAARRENAKGCFKMGLVLLTLCIVALFVQTIPKSGEQLKAPDGEYYLMPPPVNFVNDSGHVLDPAAEVRLEKLLREYEYYTSAELFVVTTQRAQGYDANAFATILGNQWQAGKFGKDNGIILYVCASQMPAWDEPDSLVRPHGYYGEGYLAIGQGLETYISDAQSMRIVREHLAPAVVAHRYEMGIKACVDEIIGRTKELETTYTQSNEFAQRRVKEEPLTTETLQKGILGWLADTMLYLMLTALAISPIIGVCYFFRKDKQERFFRFYMRWLGRVLLFVVFFSFRGAASKTASKLTGSGAKAAGGVFGGAGGGARV